jgi:hypothetical protein
MTELPSRGCWFKASAQRAADALNQPLLFALHLVQHAYPASAVPNHSQCCASTAATHL